MKFTYMQTTMTWSKKWLEDLMLFGSRLKQEKNQYFFELYQNYSNLFMVCTCLKSNVLSSGHPMSTQDVLTRHQDPCSLCITLAWFQYREVATLVCCSKPFLDVWYMHIYCQSDMYYQSNTVCKFLIIFFLALCPQFYPFVCRSTVQTMTLAWYEFQTLCLASCNHLSHHRSKHNPPLAPILYYCKSFHFAHLRRVLTKTGGIRSNQAAFYAAQTQI